METELRAALIAWLQADPALAAINAVEEEAPLRATPPWLGIAASASADWSTKDLRGREIRIALELHHRGDDPAANGALVKAIDRRIESLPQEHTGFRLVSTLFLKARAEKRPRNLRAVLLEYRFRLFDTDTE